MQIEKGGVGMSDDWTRYREELLRSIGYEEGKRIGEARAIRGFLKFYQPEKAAEILDVSLERVLEVKEGKDCEEISTLQKKERRLEALFIALDYFKKLEFENTGGLADHLVKEALRYLPSEFRDMVSDEVSGELLDMATAIEEKCRSSFLEYKQRRIESISDEIKTLGGIDIIN